MKRNLTVSLPGELIRSAKVLAVKQGASLNALIREDLEKRVRAEKDYQESLEWILKTARKGLYRVPKRRPSRADLYD